LFVGVGVLLDVAVFAAEAEELEEVLEECDELIFALAVGEEEGPEDGEVAGAYEDLLRELFGYLAGLQGAQAQVVQGTHALERHRIL
jgi:hypothetical protein